MSQLVDASTVLTQPPQRPPLERRGTSYASQPSTQNAGPSRLLWRGSFVTPQGFKLYGIAIIAHLFSVPSTTTPAASSPASFSPFDDPFSSNAKATNSGADMCLGLEMLRGKDLHLDGDDDANPLLVQHVLDPSAMDSDSAMSSPELARSSSLALRKGKGKEKDKGRVVKVETPTDVRVYIDERCTDTVEWFQDQFCREGCQGRGIKLDAGGEPIIIFAQLPSPNEASTTTPSDSPSTSTSTASPNELPQLTLLLGRPFKPVVRKPRPDDPLPRESLFTAKLRKTASLPAAAFSKTSLSASASTATGSTTKQEKKKRLTSKDKAIASLMGKTDSDLIVPAPRVPQRRQSSIPPSMPFPLPLPSSNSNSTLIGGGAKRSLSRSLSTSSNLGSSRLFSTSSRQGSLPPPPSFTSDGTSATTTTTTSSSSRPFKRSRSSLPTTSTSISRLFTASPPPLSLLGTSFDLSLQQNRRGSTSSSRAPPSPTPSIASTSFGTNRIGDRGGGTDIKEEEGVDGDDDDGGELNDRLEELREIGIKRQRSTNGITGRAINGGGGGVGLGMKRSLSVPVGGAGKFLSGGGGNGNGNGKDEMRIKVEDGEVNAIETRNKNTVKKFTATRLTALGVGKDHPEFRDLFAMVSRGVGFALRSTYKTKVLSPVDRMRAEELVEIHLRLYLPPEASSFAKLQIREGGEEWPLKSGELQSMKTVEELELAAVNTTQDGSEMFVATEERRAALPKIGDEERDEARVKERKEGSSDTVVGDELDMHGERGVLHEKKGVTDVDAPADKMNEEGPYVEVKF